jgi:pimeloyl-ACP methyl ester carboxylesterase
VTGGEHLVEIATPDGLTLAARDYPSPAGAGTVLCLHGLTRNSRDFAGLAEVLQPDWRVLAPDQRGRGRSTYDPEPLNYTIPVQCRDTWALLDALDVERFAVVGTSMGALMAIVMANTQPGRIAALVLNDAGPVIDPAGVARIRSYVGQGGGVSAWEDAAEALKAVHGAAYPTYASGDWLRMARATYRQDGAGLRLDHDPALARALAVDNPEAGDLWPAFEVLRTIPALVVRGARSDILAADTAAEMARRFPTTEVITIPDRGHAPDLTEPQAIDAIKDFLARAFLAP